MINAIITGNISSDLKEGIMALFTTFEGTVPLDRSFGLEIESIFPSEKNRAIIIREVLNKTKKYFPWIKINEVNVDFNDENIILKVRVENEQSS